VKPKKKLENEKSSLDRQIVLIEKRDKLSVEHIEFLNVQINDTQKKHENMLSELGRRI